MAGGALFVVSRNHCVVCYAYLTCEFIVVLISFNLIHNLFVVKLDEWNKSASIETGNGNMNLNLN